MLARSNRLERGVSDVTLTPGEGKKGENFTRSKFNIFGNISRTKIGILMKFGANVSIDLRNELKKETSKKIIYDVTKRRQNRKN